ncbi:MAG TPA: carboxypeptidase-like regulatory domain-containing protein, partial [Pyrinomonadaceae bacterium]|nr:carboxypeptidase-like regulatory domain-containing protein [Pyrinomonadaceae bacterium]
MTAVTNAQSGTATLNGIVMDQHGAVVPGAQVAVISISQGFQRNVMTSGEGTFVVPLLPPGKYTVKVEHEGFNPAELPNVVLNVADLVKLDISLKVRDLTNQSVDVVENASLINESPAVGTIVN